MNYRRNVYLVSVLVAVGALSIACSSSGTRDQGGGGASGGAGSKLTGTPIKLGTIMDSFLAQVAPSGAKAAISAINAHGGVMGHPLQLVVCDNQQNANDAAACARTFANDSSIVATIGDTDSFGSESNPPLVAAKIAGIGTNPLSSGDFASPRIFALSNGGLEFLAGAQFLLKSLKTDRMGMVVVGTPGASERPTLVNNLVLKPSGSKLAGVASVPVTATDLSSQAASLRNTNGQLLAIPQSITVRYITASRQQGYTGPFMISETVADAQQLSKEDVTSSDLGQLYGMTYFNKQSPGYNQFLTDMNKYQNGVHPTDLSALTWLSVETFAKVAATLPVITRQTIWNAMNMQTDLTTQGMTQPLDYTVPGNALGGTAPRLVGAVQVLYIDRYQDGKWEPNYSPQITVPLFPTP
jgi:branched-chain amino acid transport system substrate-binding protein